MSDVRREIRDCALCFAVMFWAALLIPANLEAETSPEPADSMESAATTEKAYRLPLPGADLRMRYLLAGEDSFHSRELKKAREAFEKVLDLDSQSAQAHYFLGLIEYEEGNIEEAKTRFQIAHECLGPLSVSSQLPIDAKQVQVEFPHEYESRVYYMDGWYVTPKESAVGNRNIHLLAAGSAYRIRLKPKHSGSWIRKGIVGVVIAFSFFLAR